MRDDDTHTQDQYDDHMQRVDQIKRDFIGGRITVTEKRRRIADENKAYYRDESIRPPKVRDEIAGVIADATGVPVETARMALNARRHAYAQAADSDSVEDARKLIQFGTENYTHHLKGNTCQSSPTTQPTLR
jgi:hypothetical protein